MCYYNFINLYNQWPVISLRKKFFRTQAQRAGNRQILEARKKLHRPELFFCQSIGGLEILIWLVCQRRLLQWHPFLSLIKRICISACLLLKKGILVCFVQSSKDSTSPMSKTCKIRTGQVKFQDRKPDWTWKIVESKLLKKWGKTNRNSFL